MYEIFQKDSSMHKTVIVLVSVVLAGLWSGCGSISGMANSAAPRGYHTKVIYNQKIAKTILSRIKRKEIHRRVGRPIDPKDVMVFNEASIPKQCYPIGYVAVYDPSGFEEKTNAFGYRRSMTPKYYKLLREKAAHLGVRALNDYMGDLTGSELTIIEIATNNPYVAKQYTKYKYSVMGQIMEWEKCPQESQCDKKSSKYKFCVRSCFKNRPPKKGKIIYYAMTAMKCDPKFLQKLRSGENIDAINIENKFKSLFKK